MTLKFWKLCSILLLSFNSSKVIFVSFCRLKDMSKVKKQELFLHQEQFRSKYHTVSHYEVFPWNVKKLVRGATNSFVVVIFYYSFFTTPPFWRENLSKRDQDKPTYVSNTSSDMTELRGNRLKCNELKSATYYVSTNCLLPDGSAAYTMNDLLKNRPIIPKFCHKLEERIP